jgi:hypothetical protein
MFKSPQASSSEDANIIESRQAPVHLTNAPCFFILNICFMFYFDGALSYRSCDAIVAFMVILLKYP